MTRYKCNLANHSMVLTPQGNFAPCCSTPDVVVGNISEIDDINELYRESPVLDEIRGYFKGDQSGYNEESKCRNCYIADAANVWSTRRCWEEFAGADKWDDLGFEGLKHLELTTSNVCNATCSTCFSFYSSSWSILEKKHDIQDPDERLYTQNPVQKISDADIEKIKKIIPGLQCLQLKGGEPFADARNIDLMNHFIETNEHGMLNILSNGSLVKPEMFKSLKDTGRIVVSFSVDGLGDLYEWIRSTDFKKVNENAKKMYEYTGRKVDYCSTLSLHNFFRAAEWMEELVYNPEYEHIAGGNIQHEVEFPYKTCSRVIDESLHNDVVQESVERLTKLRDYCQSENDRLDKEKYYMPFYNDTLDLFANMNYNEKGGELRFQSKQKWKEAAHNHIKFLDMIRGKNLYDIVPELQSALQ